MTISDEINFCYFQWIIKLYIINQAKVLQLTAADPVVPNVYSGTFHVLRLSPGIVATDPVIWGMLQHLDTLF